MVDRLSRIEQRIRAIEGLLGGLHGTKEDPGGGFAAALSRVRRRAEISTPQPVDGGVPEPSIGAMPVVVEAAARTGLPTDLIAAVIAAESGGNPAAVSRAGALGLMQLMPATARELGVGNPLDPRENVLGGAEYLRRQLARFGSLEKALAAYNAGPGAVERYGDVPPYRETRSYVRRVLESLR